ncbi:hypothetical protein [Streptomyces sp. NPDC007264]|uniref:hypothetical protein n=1 Tax=Streptomyces sp. NPDC007264 TaxID=3364777 RepID=UPI0036D76096
MTDRTGVNALLVQQVAEPTWAEKPSAEDRRAPTASSRSEIAPYGTVRLDMDKRLERAPTVRVPGPRRAVGDTAGTGDSPS